MAVTLENISMVRTGLDQSLTSSSCLALHEAMGVHFSNVRSSDFFRTSQNHDS